MKYWQSLIGFFFTSCALAQPATLVLQNGNIYTANDNAPHAQAIAVAQDRILFVGSNNDMKRYINPRTNIIDLHGATVLPGLTDAHAHFIGIGEREMAFNLEKIKSINELLMAVKTRASKAKTGEWIIGQGWIETYWKPPVFPTREQLDRVAPDNPVYLSRSDWHSSVANSAALKIAGITKQTKNPFGGEILHDPKTGEPTGMLLDNAQDLVSKHITPATAAHYRRAALLADLWGISHGLTQIQEPGSTWEQVEIYQKLYRQGKLKIRLYEAMLGPGKEADRLLRQGPMIDAYQHHFNLRSIKVIADGALGSRGAALLQPYSDAPDSKGFLTVHQQEYQAMLQKALRKGIQVETHAIGDAANRFVLDESAQAFTAVPNAERKIMEPRWRIEHAQIIHPDDLSRFAALHIIPSMQPSHAISDLHFAGNRLGTERLKGAYAWQALIKSGVIIPGGSDAPVESGDPIIEFYAATIRKDVQGKDGTGWHLEQAVTREQALRMLTLWPAYAAFEEHLRGSIEPGKLADFTVLSKDIMVVPAKEILTTRPMMTVIGGQVVFVAHLFNK
jgi:predicted amidohydrolase YtcJ